MQHHSEAKSQVLASSDFEIRVQLLNKNHLILFNLVEMKELMKLARGSWNSHISYLTFLCVSVAKHDVSADRILGGRRSLRLGPVPRPLLGSGLL